MGHGDRVLKGLVLIDSLDRFVISLADLWHGYSRPTALL